jgi:hypothetical protein
MTNCLKVEKRQKWVNHRFEQNRITTLKQYKAKQMRTIERKLVKNIEQIKRVELQPAIRTKNGRSSKEISTWYQDHNSKIINTKSKSIRPNRIQFNSHVRPHRILRCGQLKVSCTCRFDVGTSIFLFDNSTPNLTRTSSAGASVQLITYDYRPSGP